MSGKLSYSKRYQDQVVIDHLASNYVLGTLSETVRKRTQKLCQLPQNRTLSERIIYWENKLSSLIDDVPELAPKTQIWEQIEGSISSGGIRSEAAVTGIKTREVDHKTSVWSFFGFPISHFVTAFSLLLAVFLGISHIQETEPLGTLSYVAVMTDDNEKPQVVAATYGESQTLLLDILDLPDIDSEESYELWVTSKTDRQTRSLGIIPSGIDSFSRELTIAEWRLIKDSDSLLITVEEAGGSSIGSPMGDMISKGLCIRLSAWQET